MARRVLSVGQCGFDHMKISRYLRSTFGAEVDGADSFDEAISAIQSGMYDLVLVNRVTDFDGSSGVELIRTLKADPELARFPVMLVSDQVRAQNLAEAEGAFPGFGKADLNTGTAQERLRPILDGG